MWNYRILDHGDHFALHEVFYTPRGRPRSWTEDAITFGSDPEEGADGIIGSLEMALADARKHPVLRVRGEKLVPVKTLAA